MRALTDDEKKVAWAWASWTAAHIRDSLQEVEIERVDDDGFLEIVTEVLRDIAQSNALRVDGVPRPPSLSEGAAPKEQG